MAVAEQSKPMQLVKSKSQWAALLPPPAYRVLFEEETERAGTRDLRGRVVVGPGNFGIALAVAIAGLRSTVRYRYQRHASDGGNNSTAQFRRIIRRQASCENRGVIEEIHGRGTLSNPAAFIAGIGKTVHPGLAWVSG